MMTHPFRSRLCTLIRVLALVFCLFALLPAAAFADIEIATAADLIALSKQDFAEISNETIKLTADIDMSGQTAIAPLGGSTPFNGTFDGQGHYIRSLSITGTGNCTGLFGYVGTQGKIQNLGLYNVTVSGKDNTGSIAGVMTGSVMQCYATGSVTGKYATGGLVGLLHAGVIENCWTDTAVTGTTYAAGLFGGTDWTADGNTTPLTDGITDKPMIIRNNLILGTVSGNSAGGMLGDMGNSKTSPLQSFNGNIVWSKSVSATASSYGPVFAWWTNGTRKNDTLPMQYDNLYWDKMPLPGKSPYASDDNRYTTYRIVSAGADVLGKQATYAALNWDFTNVWTWNDLLGHPVLKNVSLYKEPSVLIYTVEDFLEFADPKNFASINGKKAYLMNDLDLSGVTIEPIGGTQAYTGVFDGRDHTLTYLTVTGTGSCTGLFGYVGTQGQIKNLGLDRVSVTGSNNMTGSLAGVMTGSVSECYVTGTVSGGNITGGIAGMLQGGTISDCWTDLTVSGKSYVGGIFGTSNWEKTNTPLTGNVDKPMLVTNCLTLGTVSASNSYVGGILGEVGNSKTSAISLFEGNAAWVEALSGNAYHPIYGWWSTGRLNVKPNQDNVYFDKMTLPTTNPASSSDQIDPALRITSRTAAQLGKQETYETGLNWDFDTTWVWSTKLGHPVLQGFAVPDDYIPGEQKTPASLVTTYAGSPKTTRAFTWYTDADITGSVVQIVKASEYTGTASFSGSVTGTSYKLQTSEDGDSRTIHKVNVTDLEPGTAYRYHAGDGTYWSGVYTFTTEPEEADSFTFFSMTDTQAQYARYANVLNHATTNYPEGAFILHGGDVIQNNATPDYDSVFKLTSQYAATLPTMVTPGNHELAKDTSNDSFTADYVKGLDNYLSHYQFPDNGPVSTTVNGKQVNYSFDYGNAHFVVLNTNLPSGIKRADYNRFLIEWLTQDIAATQKTWKIVSLHHGPYSAYGTSNSTLIAAMAELDIDLVMFGHNHVLLRSNPIADGVPADSILQTDGSYLGYASTPSYYSSGCAGGNTSSLSATNERHEESLKLFAVNAMPFKGSSYGAITVTEDSITIRTHAVATSGSTQLVDTYVITKPKASGSASGATLTYNGKPQKLIASASAEGGDMLYSLDNVNFTDAIPTGVNAGSYTIYCKVSGGAQHSDSEVYTVTASIAPLDLSSADLTVTLGETPVYTGSEVTQTVESVTANGLPVTCTVSGNTGKKVGEYTLTITGTGNFTGSVSAAWRIAPAPDLPQTGDSSILPAWAALAAAALMSIAALSRKKRDA